MVTGSHLIFEMEKTEGVVEVLVVPWQRVPEWEVPWKTCFFDEMSLGQNIPYRCVPTLDRIVVTSKFELG